MHQRLRRSGWLLTAAMVAIGYGLDVLGWANSLAGLGLLSVGAVALFVWVLSLMVPTPQERRAKQRRAREAVPQEPPSTLRQAMVVVVTNTGVRRGYAVFALLTMWTLLAVGVTMDQDYLAGIGMLMAVAFGILAGVFDNLFNPVAIRRIERGRSYRVGKAVRSWVGRRWWFK